MRETNHQLPQGNKRPVGSNQPTKSRERVSEDILREFEMNLRGDPKVEQQKRKAYLKQREAKRRKIRRQRRILFATVTVILIALIVGLIVLFHSLSGSNSINGKWAVDSTTVYQFNEDGTGSLILPSDEYAFTYTVTDGVLSIDFENNNAKDREYEYSIEKGVLTIKDTSTYGDTYTLTSVK